MKKKSGVKVLFIVLSVILLAALGLYIAGNLYYTDAKIYEINWDITLPSGLEKQYTAKDVGGTGDGARYTVFKLKENNSTFLDQLSSEKNTEMEAAVKKVLTNLKVEKQNYPDFSQDYKWRMMGKNGVDTLYIIYDPKLSRVYFMQVLI